MGFPKGLRVAAATLVSIAVVVVAVRSWPSTSQDPPPSTSQDWSTAVVDAAMARTAPADFGWWNYHVGFYLYGQYLVYQRTGDARYLAYLKAWADRFVGPDGRFGESLSKLDHIQPGVVLLILAGETGDPRYRTAADTVFRRLDTWPRTADGGWWHTTDRRYQLWADGVFMVLPFLVRYGHLTGRGAAVDDEAVHQLLTYHRRLVGPTGLLHHAYDESRAMAWADPATGRSPEVWCRAVGWYGMAATEVLEWLPADHPRRNSIVDIVRSLVVAFARYQDPDSGRWFQVVDKGGLAGNWTETSCSSMYTFVVSRAVERGYVDAKYAEVAAKGHAGVLARVATGGDGRPQVSGICVGTGVGDLAWYLARPRQADDPHGLGAFLVMNEQMSR